MLGIPCSLLLGFACDLRAIGLWLGMLVGPFVQMILYARWAACGKTMELWVALSDEDDDEDDD